ncbi:MAG: dihydropteroate synthase [Planctomycetaceae bacterium]
MDNLRTWQFRDVDWRLGDAPLLMGIVNVTPDSFSDGGEFFDPDAAVAHALQLVDDGAVILDIGGESTRPGSRPVSPDEELRRVVPVIEQLAKQTPTPISIDTTKAEVARRAIDAGAAIVNDISGLTFDPEMPAVCRKGEVGVVCMHIQGTPQTMQDDPTYEDVVAEIRAFFENRLAALQKNGIPPERVVLDPGIGFGKTAEHNVQILSNIRAFRALGRPVLIGHSRKRFLKTVLGRDVEERTAGSIGVSLALAAQSADVLRVHDVRSVRDALMAYRIILPAE